MQQKDTTVFVGISGGVDSSVAALRLKRAGYTVVGVFIKTWQPDFVTCTWRAERRDAMRVCAQLGIPFVTCDLSEAYRTEVAEYMIAEYRAGRTPNPDVMCNQAVKFGAFLSWAMRMGADYIATGHYARIKNTRDGYALMRGVDHNKDQSYFLWTLTQAVLARVLFPIGGMYKKQVRSQARRYRIPTAEKKDSQGVCFLGPIDMKTFLRHYIPDEPGEVVDESGVVIGHHTGAHAYTLGERHNFTITQKGTASGPWYVVAKDIAANTITVSPHPQTAKVGPRRRVQLTQTNWIGGIPDEQPYQVQVRHRGKRYPATITAADPHTADVVFSEPVFPVASGQSLVGYRDAVCVGGGIVV